MGFGGLKGPDSEAQGGFEPRPGRQVSRTLSLAPG